MKIDQALKSELNSLSKEVFGSSSRWEKLVKKGYAEVETQEVTELVPGATDEESTTRQVQVPVMHNGMKKMVKKFHTVESVKALMLEKKQRIEEIKASIQKQIEEVRAKKEEEEKTKLEEQKMKQIAEDLAGSAV
jgi:hypothetical protein